MGFNVALKVLIFSLILTFSCQEEEERLQKIQEARRERDKEKEKEKERDRDRDKERDKERKERFALFEYLLITKLFYPFATVEDPSVEDLIFHCVG